MDSFPIPKLRSSWAAALIMFLLLFFIYYLIVFEKLLDLYKSQFDIVYFEQSEMQLNVSAYVPHYYDASDAALVYVHVQNESDDPVYDVGVYLVATFEESALLLPKVYIDDVYSSKSEFDVLPPNAISIARVSLVAQNEPTITKVIVIQKQDGVPEELERLNPTDYIRVQKAIWKSLQHRFLEVVLLPPWSNGYIFGLVILSIYLVRKGTEEKEPDPFTPGWWDLVVSTLGKSFGVLASISSLTLLMLFTDETTLSRSLCIVGCLLILVLRINLWKENITDDFRKGVVVFSAFWLAALGVMLAVSGPIWAIIVSLFPDMFQQVDFSSLGTNVNVNFVIFLVAFGLALLSRKYLDKLNFYVGQLRVWGWAFALIGATAIVVLFSFVKEETGMEYVLWALLMIGGLGLLFISRNDPKPHDTKNRQTALVQKSSRYQGRR